VSAVPSDAAHACPHCGTPVEEPGFCCGGCEAAAAIIAGAGADAYYRERTALPARPMPVDAAWDAVPMTLVGDMAEVRLSIDGLRCASCVWVVERVLEAADGVEDAHVSYASGQALLRFKPEKIDLTKIAQRIESLGYQPRPVDALGSPDHDLLVRFGFACFIAANVMSLHAAVYAGWLGGMEERYLALFLWLSLALTTPTVLWAAAPFFKGAWQGLKHGLLHMDVPISLAIGVLYAHGVISTLLGHETWLDSVSMLVALLLGGRVLEARGRRRAAEAATALAAQVPRNARRVTATGVERVRVEQLRAGDVLQLASGEEIAADGVVTAGAGQLRMALLTGESAPVAVREGVRVIAGAVVVEGNFTVRVDNVGDETVVAQMAQAVREATERGMTSPVDRIAPAFTAATLVIAALAGVGWGLHGGVALGVERCVAVLVVACPCALALSWPLAATASIGAAARRGLLVRSAQGLLALADIDAVVLDKTGTATSGELRITRADDAVVRIAAGLERASIHPIARAIVDEAAARGIPLPTARDIVETPGSGLSGLVDGVRYTIRAGAPGTVLLDGPDGLVGELHLRDTLRADTAVAVQRLRAMGLEPELLTGDRDETAQAIAAEAGFRVVRSEVGPLEKQQVIADLQAKGHRVLFAGDGLNDAPAIASADVGVAMGGGAVSSVLSADAVVLERSIVPLVAGIRAARAARAAIRSNMQRSIAYNMVTVLAAVAGGVNPLVAAILMPFSSLWVLYGAMGVERTLAREESS